MTANAHEAEHAARRNFRVARAHNHLARHETEIGRPAVAAWHREQADEALDRAIAWNSGTGVAS